jgi:hypothetical protein
MEIWRVEVLNLSTREEANHQLHTLAALSFIPGELTSHTYCMKKTEIFTPGLNRT